MSGGSLDYVYARVNDAVDTIERRATTPLQRAFGKHLKDISDALYNLEMLYSGDCGKGDEVESLSKCVSKEMVLSSIVDDAKLILEQLHSALNNVK